MTNYYMQVVKGLMSNKDRTRRMPYKGDKVPPGHTIPRFFKSGIYQIRCRVNDNCYIGASEDIRRRWINHINDLRNNRHRSSLFQQDWDAYGEDAFEFTILETIKPSSSTFFVRDFHHIEVRYIRERSPAYNTVNK